MYHHDPSQAVADMLYMHNAKPDDKRELVIKVYPKAMPNHHKAGAVYVQYSPEGAGIWTTMLGLAKAMIIADERLKEMQ